MTEPGQGDPLPAGDEAAPRFSERGRGFSRRGLLVGAVGGLAVGGAAGAAAVAAASAAGTAAAETDEDLIDLTRAFPFYGGAHQAGIAEPQQRHCVYMTFDLTSALATDLQVLLARWSGAIAQLMAGKPIGQVEPARPSAVGVDTGEALDIGPAGLTVTLGLGPGVFDARFGLAAKKPALLADLAELPSDQLQSALTGGDLSLQACSDDPQVAYHAIRNLARMAKGTAQTRWTVMSFGRASAGANQQTPRNLMGFKDGTRNLKEKADFGRFVWVVDDAAWTRGGTYQVVRKIQMHIENWDTDPVDNQQQVFGRDKVEGAPLSGHHEFDTPNFTKRAAAGGGTAISATSHIALAAHENNGGVKILRRGYNYTDGLNQYGLLDAGLFFIAYMNTPEHFMQLQRRLGASDQLNEYISHIGSALFFVPPAPKQGEYIGQALFA